MKDFYLAILLGAIFFIAGLLTLPHYGINWDSINHLPRGQAYLNYFLTGRKDFSNFKDFSWYWQKPEDLGISTKAFNKQELRRSFYQSDNTPFSYFVEFDGNGHPPLSDILSSTFNFVLFQRLGWVNDIDSYRVYGIFLGASLIALVFWWGSKVYGFIAGVVTVLSLALYPLFWSEVHFNTEKDIPETVFWSFLIFCVWKGFVEKKWLWLLSSGIFLGLALGTKFNIFFSVLVTIPWVSIVLVGRYLKMRPDLKQVLYKNSKLVFSGLFAPFLGLAIFVGTWPYLWSDPIKRISGVIGFYKTIGTTSNVDLSFAGPFGINTYPLQWIIYTTPLIILLFLFIGLVSAYLKVKNERDKISLLFLLWLVVPIVRVSWPGTTIYGGIRQIMEYVPGLALLAGLGGVTVYHWILLILNQVKWAGGTIKKIIAGSFIIILFVPLSIKLIQIHPNENVYFNPLIGGLEGAKNHNLPSWGNTFGSAYRQGIVWLNNHAEHNAKIAFARELLPNIPSIWVRPDLILHNSFRSGFLKNGEYIIALTYEGVDQTSYFDRYLDQILIPVYEAKVDNVAILKVWKNDKQHTREEFLDDRELSDFQVLTINEGLKFDFKKVIKLEKIETDFDAFNCKVLKSGSVSISENGLDWRKLPGKMPREDWNVPAFGDQPSENHLLIPFAADRARYVEINISPKDACLKNLTRASVFFFP